MKELKSFIGEESSQRFEKFSPQLIADFKATVRSPGLGPTIWTRCREGEFELVSRVGLELKQILHADQIYEFHLDPQPDVAYRYRTRLVQVVDKQSGDYDLSFMTFESPIIRDSDGAVAAVAKSTMVYRRKRGNA